MEIKPLLRGDPRHPHSLETFLGRAAPKQLAFVGNLGLLDQKSLALFCSNRCPGNLILKTYDLAVELREANIPVIGGFHTPMEQECLHILLRGTQPIILCLARTLGARQILPAWRAPLEDGHLLLLSPFHEKSRRVTTATSEFRNRVVAGLASRVFVAYAAPHGKTEQLCRTLVAWGKPLYTFDAPANEHLMRLGAKPIESNQFSLTRFRE